MNPPGRFVYWVISVTLIRRLTPFEEELKKIWWCLLQSLYSYPAKKHTKHLPTPRRFDLRPTGPCFVFVYLLLIAMTSIFGLLDKRQRAEARRKKQTSGPGRFLLGGKIGAAPKGVLPKRIQMKPTDEQGSLNRTHFLRYQNVWSCWRISF